MFICCYSGPLHLLLLGGPLRSSAVVLLFVQQPRRFSIVVTGKKVNLKGAPPITNNSMYCTATRDLAVAPAAPLLSAAD